jgi:hypothetical protein
METIRLLKTYYETMKNMLKSHIKSHVYYNGNLYVFEDFFEYCINNTTHIECVLSYDIKKSITIPITELIKIYYPTIIFH